MATGNEHIGRWQVTLLLLLGCNYLIVGINHTLPTFQGYTPNFFCQVGNDSAVVEGCVDVPSAQDEPSCPQGYQFESDRGDWTIVTEWQLVCERRYLRSLIATLYFCGVTIGAVVCGLLADRYGRRLLVLICLYAQGLLGVSLYFTQTFEAFMAVRIIQGFFVQGLQGTTFALLVELFPPQFRTAVGVVLELYWASGLIYLSGASYFVPNWRTLELLLSIPTAVTLLYVCLVPESPLWLAVHGRVEVRKGWKRAIPCNQSEKLIDTNSMQNETIALKRTEYAGGPLSQNTENQQVIKNDTTQNKISITVFENVGPGHADVATRPIARSGEERKEIAKENVMGDKLTDCSGRCDDSSVCTENVERNFGNLCNEDVGDFDKSGYSNYSSAQTTQDLKDGDRGLIGLQRTCEIRDKTRVEYDKNQGVCTGKTLSVGDKNLGTSQVASADVSAAVPEDTGTTSDVVLDGNMQLNRNGGDVSNSTEVICRNVGKKLEIVPDRTVAGTQEIMATSTKRTGFFELVRSPVLRKYNLVMVFVWFSVSLLYYGIMFHIPDLSGERHLNFFLGAVVEVISYVLAYVILSRFGRRLPMASFLLVSGVICIVVGAISAVPGNDAYWIGVTVTTLALIGKGVAVSGFCTMFLYASELFPTVIRGVAMGHCGFWARVGSLLAPQLLFLGESTLSAVPLVIMGILGMLAGLSVLLLPETLGQKLPDTIEEAEIRARN